MARIMIEKDIEIPMRDGCVLKGDLYRPDSNEKLPVLLNRTPYDKKFPLISSLTLDSIRAAQRGYNVVFVDCRGRFASQGTFTCFVDEPRDGYDTIEWLARQPFADGKVGMFGASYMGATQWLAATQAPPSLKAMVPSITASDYHNGCLPGRGVRAVLQCELDDDLAWARKADTRARRKSGGERRTRHRDGIDRPYVRPDGFHAAAGVPDVPRGRTLFLRLARASLLRRLLAQALHRGVPRQNRGADAEYRGMVRHLPGGNDSKSPGDARPWRVGGGAQLAPDAGSMESWLAASEPGRPSRYGLSLEPGLRRPRRHATGFLRRLAQRQTERGSRRRARTNLRDGPEPVARGEGMAAARHRVAALLSA